MKPKILRLLASIARAVSYTLVFYAGLAIGVGPPEDVGVSPIVALLFAVLLGSSAGTTTAIAVEMEKDTIKHDSRSRNLGR